MSAPAPIACPAPDASTDAVLAWALRGGVGDSLDVSGRPLGEQAAPALYARAPRRERRLRFRDPRDATGHPANVAALEQARGAWPWLMRALRARAAQEPAPTVGAAWRVAAAANALALTLRLRDPRPEARLPVRVAALYKVTLGFAQVLPALLLEVADANTAARLRAEVAPTDAFLGWLDEGGWLIGQSQVCAGSRRAIVEVLDALGEGAGGGRGGAADGEDDEALATLTSAAHARVTDALCVLSSLTMAAVAAARVCVARGALVEAPDRGQADPARGRWPACLRLLEAPRPPRLVDLLLARPGSTPARVARLHAADARPPALTGLLEDLDGLESAPRPLAAIDAAWAARARPVAARFMAALGRPDARPLSDAALVALVGEGG